MIAFRHVQSVIHNLPAPYSGGKLWITRPCRRAAGHGQRGFTIIELMVTLVIIVVMSTLVVVAMDKELSEARLRSGCRMVVSAMIYARSSAVAHRTYTQVVFDKASNAVSVELLARDERGDQRMMPLTTPSGRYRRLPRGIEIARVTKPEAEQEENYVRFSELGQAEDAVVTIQDATGKKRMITVDATTGRCAIKTGGEA